MPFRYIVNCRTTLILMLRLVIPSEGLLCSHPSNESFVMSIAVPF